MCFVLLLYLYNLWLHMFRVTVIWLQPVAAVKGWCYMATNCGSCHVTLYGYNFWLPSCVTVIWLQLVVAIKGWCFMATTCGYYVFRVTAIWLQLPCVSCFCYMATTCGNCHVVRYWYMAINCGYYHVLMLLVIWLQLVATDMFHVTVIWLQLVATTMCFV